MGTAAIQLAKTVGAKIIGTSSKWKHKQLKDFENAKSKASLFVGAVVEVDSPKVINPGKILKINRSKAKVEVGDMIWNVPLGMLKVVA